MWIIICSCWRNNCAFFCLKDLFCCLSVMMILLMQFCYYEYFRLWVPCCLWVFLTNVHCCWCWFNAALDDSVDGWWYIYRWLVGLIGCWYDWFDWLLGMIGLICLVWVDLLIWGFLVLRNMVYSNYGYAIGVWYTYELIDDWLRIWMGSYLYLAHGVDWFRQYLTHAVD